MKPSFQYILIGLAGGLLLFGWWWHTATVTTIPQSAPETMRSYYEPLVPMTLAGVSVFASVADTTEARQLGLSRTTLLPADVIKLFVFPNEDFWSFWMKEMSYPIDIIWLDATGKIVHIEEQVAPDTYPTSFAPQGRAQYVIETNAGFVSVHAMKVGDMVEIPDNID